MDHHVPQGSISLQLLLDSFVAIASETDPGAILEQAVDLARLSTQSRYGAAVTISAGGITAFVHRGLTSAQVGAMPHEPNGLGMLGAVLEDKSPIRLERLQDDRRSVGFPLGHVPMEAFLGVPIVFDAELLGALYLTKAPGQGAYGEQDEMFMQALARQTGGALATAALLRAKDRVAAELEAANRAKSDFVSMASHELRTPLTSILGFASTMLTYWESTPDREKHEYVATIERQAERLSRLVGELLTMARIESGVAGTTQAVDVGSAIVEAVATFGARAPELAVACPAGTRAEVDPDHLQQIIVNLVANALRYGAPPIRVDVTTSGGDVMIDVSDGGPGVPDEFVPRLFEKFAQADGGTTRTARGTGLGLSIVLGLARANEGDAWYEPGPRGARFRVRLPMITS